MKKLIFTIRNFFIKKITLRNLLKYNINPFKLFFVRYYFKKYPIITMKYYDTIRKIKSDKLSFIRFGDGEFQCISGLMINKSSGLNTCNREVRKALINVIMANDRNLLIGLVPSPKVEFYGYKKNNNLYWNEYQYYKNSKIIKLLDKNTHYGDSTCFLRREFDNQDDYNLYLNSIKLIWQGLDVVFVTGYQSRFNKDSSDMFEGLNSYKFIFTPNENAYSDFDRILLEAIIEPKNRVFLLSAGFLAKILGLELVRRGYRVVDIGHMTHYLKS